MLLTEVDLTGEVGLESFSFSLSFSLSLSLSFGPLTFPFPTFKFPQGALGLTGEVGLEPPFNPLVVVFKAGLESKFEEGKLMAGGFDGFPFPISKTGWEEI